MSRVKYVSGITHTPINLDDVDGLMIGTGADIRGHAWSYTTQSTRLSSTHLTQMSDAQVEINALKPADIDTLRRAADADITSLTPGVLLVDDTWSRRCYLTEFSYASITPTYILVKAKLVFVDDCWWREMMLEALPQSGTDGINALDYPHDYPHDYAPSVNSLQVYNASALPSSIRLVVYGPATNPQINVGGNVYRVNCAVPIGSRLVVDATHDPKTIVLVDNIGSKFNKFGSGVRGSGAGSGSYIFEPLKSGVSDIAWDGSFGFDLIWRERESELPWTS